MKYKTSALLVFLNFIFACSNPARQDNQKDSTENNAVRADSVTTDSVKGGNLVKSEAPDASVKITQGYAMPRIDDKQAQSPINILTDSAIKNSHESINLTFKVGVSAIENLGHTIQLDFKDGSTTLAGGKVYFSKQFHFHTPSEHLIDGMTFPLEMHIVNILDDSTDKNHPRYLVVAFLFKMGRENKFIKEFLNEIPVEEGKDSLQSGEVKFEDLFNTIPKNEQGYYSYKGSLTTPPYSETVDWIIKKYILEASPEQIFKIEKMEGDNARHVQALNKRRVSNS
jgi:carbonic anhydrase